MDNEVFDQYGNYKFPDYSNSQYTNNVVTTSGRARMIDREETLKAMDTWDKFGYLANHGLIRLGKENKYYVQYVRYEDMVKAVNSMPTVEAIPKEEVRQFIENIQKIKDNHNEHGEPINYGTICGILIEGYRLLDKYMEDKDENRTL